MPEVIYDEKTRTPGVFELVRSIDKNVQELTNNLYDMKREMNGRITRLEEDTAVVKRELTDLKITAGVTQHEVSSLKDDVKDIRRELSDIKGSIRELTGNYSAMQTRFNWGLVILGIFVALIQLLK